MSRRTVESYRLEAAMWRRQAEHIHMAFRPDEGLVRSLWWKRGDALVEAMMARASEHHDVSRLILDSCDRCPHRGKMLDDPPPLFTRESRVLAALFLALECEDDALAATAVE